MGTICSVVFDVGETLLDDTEEWGRWADWISKEKTKASPTASKSRRGGERRPGGSCLDNTRW